MIKRKTVSQCVSEDYCKGWNDAVGKMPKWFSVENVLPELDAQGGQYDITEEVLAIDRYEECYIGRFYIYKYQGNVVFYCAGNRTDVTHWMPLPEPPKEDAH